MCGIAGIIHSSQSRKEKNFLPEQLHAMQQATLHRGPDGSGTWINAHGNIGLAHRRLAIIDLSEAAAQPMHYLNKYSIVYNGELYNYPELKEQLQEKGYSFRSNSDTEVILAAYDCWKEKALNYFDGMFAFAIWNNEAQTLFAARDRLGEKPFFYQHQQGVFIFASEMKALWAAGVEKTPNQQLLFNFITIGYVNNPDHPEETFYQHILKLPAASHLLYSARDNSCKIQQYWKVELFDESLLITDDEAEEEFKYLLKLSVSRRLRSDVPVGTSLSGGLDSSSIAALIKECNPEKEYHSFTASFSGFAKDETAYAQITGTHLQLKQHFIDVKKNDLIDAWQRLQWHQEEPFGSASILAQYKVYELARKNNITVLLDGQGADELLAGYNKYYKWYWQELFIKRQLVRSGEIKAARALGITEPFNWKNITAALLPEIAAVLLENRYLSKALQHKDLTKEYIRQQSKEAYYATPERKNLNGALYFNTFQHGLEELLRYADRNAMAHGVEVRLPFLNDRLVSFIFSLPAHYKIRKGWSKWLQRISLRTLLPDTIIWRTDKVGFEPPQQQWMKDPAVTELVREAKQLLANEKIITQEAANRKVNASGAHEKDNYDWRYMAAAVLFKQS